jgi:hypothetical protein
MTLKLQDYSIISNELLQSLISDINYYKDNGQIVPAEKLAQASFRIGWVEGYGYLHDLTCGFRSYPTEEDFLKSEIDIK